MLYTGQTNQYGLPIQSIVGSPYETIPTTTGFKTIDASNQVVPNSVFSNIIVRTNAAVQGGALPVANQQPQGVVSVTQGTAHAFPYTGTPLTDINTSVPMPQALQNIGFNPISANIGLGFGGGATAFQEGQKQIQDWTAQQQAMMPSQDFGGFLQSIVSAFTKPTGQLIQQAETPITTGIGSLSVGALIALGAVAFLLLKK